MEKILTIKTSSVSISLVSIFAYLWIDHQVFLLYTLLLFVDFITWIAKWWVMKNLSSSKAISWFLWKFLMLLVIFSFWVFWKINDYDMSYILSWTFLALSLAELYSILANVYEIKTRKILPEYDAVAIIIRFFMDIIRNKLDDLTSKDNPNARTPPKD